MMMLEGTMWFVIAAIAIILVIVILMTRRFKGMAETNERIEENQRRAVELSERQTAALERIADAMEQR